ncbi:MAG: hypothetical protein ACRDPW_11070 [Mycobacteriales bacterium]
MSTPAGGDADDVQRPDGNTPATHGEPGAVEPADIDNQPDAAAQQRLRRRKRLILGGSVILVAAATIGVAVWYFTAPQSADSPKEAAEIYLEAIKDRDTDQAGKVLCDAVTHGKPVKVSDEYNVTKLTYSVGTPQRISGKKFRVPVTVEAEFASGEAKTTRRDTPTYQVIKEDGGWKVCGFASSANTDKSEAR